MTNEKKEILLKDLCARLPYKPICFKKITNCMPSNEVLLEEDIYSFRTGNPTVSDYGQHDYYKTVVLEIKPYLRPMSSMTEEERKAYEDTMDKETQRNYPDSCDFSESVYYSLTARSFDWLNAHHFDYRGLISKGLALQAPGSMYNEI